MKRFSTVRRVLMVQIFYQHEEFATQTMQKRQTIFGRSEALCEFTVRGLMTKFETTASALTVKSPERKRPCRTEEQLVLVQGNVTESPRKSSRRRSQLLNIPATSLHRISHKDLHMHAYKIQLTQNLKLADNGGRKRFADWVLERLAVDNSFRKQIIFSNETHFS